MTKYLVSLICFLSVYHNATAQPGFMQNIKVRNIQNLDGRWHYIIDPYKTGEGSKYYLKKQQQSKSELSEYDFERSPTLNVPGDWNSQDDKLLYYEGTIWYEHDFDVHLKPAKRYFLNFGAVNYEAHVYLNGKELGKHVGGFTPFQFEVSGVLNNGNNFVVVETDNTRHKESVPALNYDWWNYGGITRDVVLAEMPETFINDYKIQLAKGDLKTITGYVQLDGSQASQQVSINIPEAGLQTKVITDNSGKATFNIPVKKIIYWTPENPKLYDVVVSSSTDSVKEYIGFRTIEVKGTDILLNGKSIFLRGICLHEENPLIPGRARSKSDLKMLLGWAKELNCNFVRLAHYPHNEYMSQLADEMGLMLWEEIPVYWNIDWENDTTYSNAQQQLTDLITRDKNRASVIVWSVGNETPNNDAREKFMEGLADKAHSLDSTRLVAAALLTHLADSNTIEVNDPLGKELDLASFNEYYGWYTGGLPSEIHKYHFKIDYDKPVVITEVGAGALGGFHGDSLTRFSEEFQESFYKNQIPLINTIDNLRGITPWILVDFRSPKRLNPAYQNDWNRKGLFTETGKKKKAFFVMKAFYDAKEKQFASTQ